MAAGAVGALVMASVTQGDARQEPLNKHRVVLPTLRPDGAHANCTGFAASYAASVVDLEDATEAAQDAWQAWYDCEQEQSQGGKVVNLTELRAETVSILEKR